MNPVFSTRMLVLMAVGIAVNMALGQIAQAVKLPIFLDALGTMVVAVMAGPLAGLITGVATNLIWGLILSPTAAAFAPVAGVIGLAAGLLARAGMFRGPVQAAISGVVIAIALSLVAVPIRVWLFGGVTGSGADFITAWMLQTGRDLFGATLVTVITSNLADKVVTALLAWAILRGLPLRMAGDWPFLRHSRA
ncbi:energy-coupling factor transport system substrate-specific component [Paracoccus pantotrophus]|nr:energy-coupling factor transport system substrate-specific component [Paracoccus pantotrophus]